MPAELTIEQLAALSGMSVRNIRAHQARGLLAAPEVRLRVGYYGPEHLDRLRLIRELQDEGFNLAGIKRLFNDRNGTAERLARFRQVLTEPPDAERPATISAAELGRRFGVGPDTAQEVLTRAQRLGILRPAGPGRFEAPSPSLLAIAERVVARGVSLHGALAVFAEIEAHCDGVSEAFVALFVAEVWRPFQAAGMPVDRWPEIEAAVDDLRPLATDALVTIFGQRMQARLDAAFDRGDPDTLAQ